MISFLLVLLLIFLIIQHFSIITYFKRVWIAFKLPGPKAVFPFGNAFTLRNPDVLNLEFAKAHTLYGVFGRVWLLIFPVFVFLDPKDIQLVLGSKKHSEKLFLYKFLFNFLGKGLITSNGERWYSHRKYLQSFFRAGALEKFIPCYESCAKKLILDRISYDETVNITPWINQYVLSVQNETILGLSCDEDLIKDSPFRQGKLEVPDRIKNPWLLFQSIYRLTNAAKHEVNHKQKLENFVRKLIELRRSKYVNGSTENVPCIIDDMLKLSEKQLDFTEQDIIHEACTLMLAGQDSTGSAIAFTLYYLATHPEYQERCYQEINQLFKDKTEDDPLTLKEVNELRFLEMCIKETLRLQPSIIIFGRKLSEDTKIRGVKLPKGSEVFLIPYATHRIPEIYPDPENFDPERFNQQNILERHKYAYFPFSSGTRNCMGYQFALIEMKVLISLILRKFKIKPVPGVTKLNPVFRITVRAAGGIWLKFEQRK